MRSGSGLFPRVFIFQPFEGDSGVLLQTPVAVAGASAFSFLSDVALLGLG